MKIEIDNKQLEIQEYKNVWKLIKVMGKLKSVIEIPKSLAENEDELKQYIIDNKLG